MKTDPIVKPMEVLWAYEHWIDFFDKCPNRDYITPDTAWTFIEQFIGHNTRTGHSLPEKHYKCLKMLLGPNYKTVLAAYCVTNNIQWK